MTFSAVHKIFINVITNNFHRSSELILSLSTLHSMNPYCRCMFDYGTRFIERYLHFLKTVVKTCIWA